MSTVHEQLVFDLDGIPMDMPLEIKPGDPIEIFPLNEYDHVILNISAGADSMGCLFELIKQGLIYLNWSSGTNVLMDMEISTGNFGTGLVRNRILKV